MAIFKMSLLGETLHLIRKYRIRPKKRMGQSFCVDAELLKRMVRYSSVSGEDEVLEVGAGLGFLTEFLSETAKRVFAVEADPQLIKVLEDRFKERSNIVIIKEDVLKTELPRFDKVVANPPYSISSPLIFKLLERDFKNATLTLQEDFAYRLVAQKGDSNYGRLTVMAYLKAETRILEHVPSTVFHPPPRVASAVVQIVPRKAPFEVLDEKNFSDLVRDLFTQRRKKLKNALQTYVRRRRVEREEEKALIERMPYLEARVYTLAAEEFGKLFNEVYRSIVNSTKTFYKGRAFYVFSDVYKPSDDTFLIADNLEVKDQAKVLDVGTGCGILAVLVAEKAHKVVATDANPYAVQCAELNSKLNSFLDKIEVRQGRLFEAVKPDEKFDLIIFNPPYLPVREDEERSWIEAAWSGGPDGRRVTNEFVSKAPEHLEEGGVIVLLQSTISDTGETRSTLEKVGLKTRILAEKKLDFESIFLIEARKHPSAEG